MKRLDFKSYLLILAICPSAIVRCQNVPYGENVALNKPANQSSTYEERGFKFIASLGVDGKKSKDLHRDKTCSHTNAGQNSAWWSVNLNGLFFIKFIRIYQLIKRNSYSRLDGSMMYVRVEDSTWQHIQFNSSWPPEIFDVNVTLEKRISSIKLNNTKLITATMETFISICELEAYEVLACSPYIVRNGRLGVVKLGDSKQNFTYGTQLNVTCGNGYQISEYRTPLTKADSITECMSTKTWSRNLTCSAIDCGRPTGIPYHSKAIITPGIAGNTTYNATMTIQCHEGYTYSLQSMEPLRCDGNGVWIGNLGNCNANPEGTGRNVAGAAGGGTAAGICIFIIAIVVTVVFVRRGNIRREDKSSEKTFNDVQKTSSKGTTKKEQIRNSTKDNQSYGEGPKEEEIACPEPDVRMGPASSSTIHDGDTYESIIEEPHSHVIEMSEYLEPTESVPIGRPFTTLQL